MQVGDIAGVPGVPQKSVAVGKIARNQKIPSRSRPYVPHAIYAERLGRNQLARRIKLRQNRSEGSAFDANEASAFRNGLRLQSGSSR